MLELDLGSGPGEETVAQVGSKDYILKAKKECRVWIQQLKRVYGDHEDLLLMIRNNPHDFGCYYSVVGKTRSEAATKILRKMEEGCSEWDEQSKEALK